jgi:DNA gyrase subunit A
VFWQKVYDLPLGSRTAKGRALVNLVQLETDEKIFHCLAVRDFGGERQLVLATRNGIIKKTALTAYSRPLRGGLIAVKLDEGDELIGVAIVGPGEDLLLASANGMAIRFAQEDARSMGRNTRGVKGISLREGDYAVGMVVADPELSLLTVCENGFGKRTPIGVVDHDEPEEDETQTDDPETDSAAETPEDVSDETEAVSEEVVRSGMQYRRQRRGGKGVIDIRTTKRNGKVVAVSAVSEEDEVLMITAGGKIQRVRVADISQVGRNTQGVRIIRMDEDDRLVSLARVPQEEIDDDEVAEGE